MAAALIWGVNTLYLLDSGLDILGVFIANSAFTAGMVLFEIPTGVLADTRGRRMSFLLSVAILLITTLCYVAVGEFGGGLLGFAIVSVVMGLGFTFYSGAVEAWLVDALKATGHRGDLDSVFARGAIVTGAAMLVGTLGGGLLGTFNLALPFLVRAALLGVVFVFAWYAMHDLGFSPRVLRLGSLPSEMNAIAKAGVAYGWKNPPIRLLMVAAFLQIGFTTWAWYAWQPHLLDLWGDDGAVWLAGMIAALVAVAAMIGNGVVEWFSRFCGKRTTLMLWGGGVFTAASVGVGLGESFWVTLPFLLLMAVALGVMGPVRQAYLHKVIPSEQRATVISFDSMIGNAGGIGMQSGLGYVSKHHSIPFGFLAGGLATLLAVPVVFLVRRFGGLGDVIVGAAGKRGPCAAQGLPDVIAVDATARVDTAD